MENGSGSQRILRISSIFSFSQLPGTLKFHSLEFRSCWILGRKHTFIAEALRFDLYFESLAGYLLAIYTFIPTGQAVFFIPVSP